MSNDFPQPIRPAEKSVASPPALSLPKGGGALRGIDEKFSVNPANGTASISVPLALTPGRSSFGPQLALNYNSGAGNGPFGLGWGLSLPAITRKTDKGLPRYLDGEASDVFILSGAEDLVPVLGADGRSPKFRWNSDGSIKIFFYRPRIEGLFARIEKWVNQRSPENTYWRSISKDNIATYYGKTPNARIYDPKDPTRIFQWLIEETLDDKGNGIAYAYKPENTRNVDQGLVSEKKRINGNALITNRYLKSIQYGNKTPNQTDFLFKVVLDYGEHSAPAATQLPDHFVCTSEESQPWASRPDAFSNYKPGFEIRTYRLCQRVLMFHCFPELGDAPCLVRSTDFDYACKDYSYLTAVVQKSYVRDQPASGYAFKSLPAMVFTYSSAAIQSEVRTLDAESLENLPVGINGRDFQWVDFKSEGLSGILTEQADAWYYKSNLGNGKFAALEWVATKPSPGHLLDGEYQWMDLAGEGRNCLVKFTQPMAGYFEQAADNQWGPFVPFDSMPNLDWHDPNLRIIDINGDGLADLLITEDDAFVFYLSRTKAGFAEAVRAETFYDEEQGPALVFADAEQSIYLADMSGDGLVDIARIRNGEICYWPNLGYGRFGAKITMDYPPCFDSLDLFNPSRIRLADIDGTGTTDIIYLGADTIRCWFNRSGNGWSVEPAVIPFPQVDQLSDVRVIDLLGKGTACLAWSSPLPGNASCSLRYIDLMGEKPHLLKSMNNNLGKEMVFEYAPSTQLYLEDKAKGNPWVTKLPFPVHVVTRVLTYDHLSRNCFGAHYAYHHGYYDRVEREFRGFGMVEQWDAEAIGVLQTSGFPSPANLDSASYVPPVLIKTWFHTGAYLEKEAISLHLAQEYYGAPAPAGAAFEAFLATLLPDTILPSGLSLAEAREACRALKGVILRQEIYSQDGTEKSQCPYSVSERNYTLKCLQPKANNPFAVFFAYSRETLDYHYERNPLDPRISHGMTLEVDDFGNVLKSVTIGYGRKTSCYAEQTRTMVTYIENTVTNSIDAEDDYRAPLPAKTCTYELTGYLPRAAEQIFAFDDFLFTHPDGTIHLQYDNEIGFEQIATTGRQRRLLSSNRAIYRSNLLTGQLPLGQLESGALLHKTYQLALTPGLLSTVFQRKSDGQTFENLVPDPAVILGNPKLGAYVDLDGDGCWWIPSGRIVYSPDDSGNELAFARRHFYLAQRFYDAFDQVTKVEYDPYDYGVVQTTDALGNQTQVQYDYRVLQPRLITDPNGNQSAAAFNSLGLLAGTAVMGKPGGNQGDSLDGFIPDLTAQQINEFLNAADPRTLAPSLLGQATSRMIYDLECYQASGQPVFAATLAREMHGSDLDFNQESKIQISFSYSDGFGREIQKKNQAAPANEGTDLFSPRWVGSGWVIFNNKGKPVKQYEPFFSPNHAFEFAGKQGVSATLFYDPLERVVATLHPNHTYEKVVFDPWQQATWDVNDTVLLDPANDSFVRGFFTRLDAEQYLPTWCELRTKDVLSAQVWSDPEQRANEKDAAFKTTEHAATPTLAYFDTLGRPFLTIADNAPDKDNQPQKYETHVEVDIQGNTRKITDALGRVVMHYDYDLLKNKLHQNSMDAGERWMLVDALGKPIRSWDCRNHTLIYLYDALHRPMESRVQGGDGPAPLNHVFDKTIYGENQFLGGKSDQELNLRTKPFVQYDTAGKVQFEGYDFKGNPLQNRRWLIRDYKQTMNWSGPDVDSALEDESFTHGLAYDALNRVIRSITPDGSITRPIYNEINRLEKLSVEQNGALTDFVATIDYDAKGQRTLIEYGNRINTAYEYDPLTFRLMHLQTTRGSDRLQDLFYAFDPMGNITSIRDTAQQNIYFQNQKVEPSADYRYDAIYRLIQANGREHLGQASNQLTPPRQTDFNDSFRMNLPQPGDGNAMGNYSEKCHYDAVGNILQMIHQAGNNSWARQYLYAGELATPGQRQSNRLIRTQPAGPNEGIYAEYNYDSHGNMTQMPHLACMQWDFKDQLYATSRQIIETSETPETTYYIYDSGGQRVRKITERQGGTRKNERIYLGGYEIYREYNSQGSDASLERQTLHVMDDKQRIALMEIKTKDAEKPTIVPVILVRYQFGNHLGSANLELDETGRIISYEEYYPYGSTSYQSVDSQREVTAKRYRYTGKERDDENGFYYHGARYYAPWLGRWTACDPAGMVDGCNIYCYVKNNPINGIDALGMQTDVLNNSDSTPFEEIEQKSMVSEHPDYNKPKTTLDFSDDEGGHIVGGTKSRTETEKAFGYVETMVTVSKIMNQISSPISFLNSFVQAVANDTDYVVGKSAGGALPGMIINVMAVSLQLFAEGTGMTENWEAHRRMQARINAGMSSASLVGSAMRLLPMEVSAAGSQLTWIGSASVAGELSVAFFAGYSAGSLGDRIVGWAGSVGGDSRTLSQRTADNATNVGDWMREQALENGLSVANAGNLALISSHLANFHPLTWMVSNVQANRDFGTGVGKFIYNQIRGVYDNLSNSYRMFNIEAENHLKDFLNIPF
jgi:RHS repeat-associated protein